MDRLISNSAMGSSREARKFIVDELERRLVGPLAEDEVIPNRAYDTYHTGFLSPVRTPVDEEEDDQDTGDSNPDNGAGEAIMTLANLAQQSAMGMSFQIDPTDTAPIRLIASWGEYKFEQKREDNTSNPGPSEQDAASVSVSEDADNSTNPQPQQQHPRSQWRRVMARKEISLPLPGHPTPKVDVNGIQLSIIDRIQGDARVLTFSIVNKRTSVRFPDDNRIYQVQLIAESENGEPVFVARPPSTQVYDEEFWNYELLYRHQKELAIGHGCSVDWETNDGRRACRIRTCWIPHVEVRKAAVNVLEGSRFLELDYLCQEDQRLGVCEDLEQLVTAYESWIDGLDDVVDMAAYEFAPAHREQIREVCQENIDACRRMAERIRHGIAYLRKSNDDSVWKAFCLANQAMARSMYKSRPDRKPCWRAFQLAFILVCLPSAIDPDHEERHTLDLIWFPTGGGKTEAYLGLSALTIFHRRLVTNTAAEATGTTVLTRYTLRLLTIQQFERATRMICACELIRQENRALLGDVPFTSGLYVGSAATPNTLDDAKKLLSGATDDEESVTTLPLAGCPWCGEELRREMQKIVDRRLVTLCPNENCEFHDEIPIAVVDEQIYHYPPTMVVGTIDKFARMAWEPQVRKLFGAGENNPPSLIIQDELHLISDSLGTLAALYETAVDYLCTYQGRGPKIIGSTATIRRAENQCQCLFARKAVQFPPSGLIADDSFFYRNDEEHPGRLYVGIHAQGRSPKHTLVWTVGTLAQAVMKDNIPDEKLRDPFHTQVLYFNSLRELGGALVLAEDDVPRFLKSIVPLDGPLPRELVHMKELTGQVPSSQIKDMFRDLAKSLYDDDGNREPLDLVFSTNMISVGIDVDRLGLMVVNGQPKTTSEYIQATSRVGRPPGDAGLVVTLYNWTRPRDRSHYERFVTYHSSFYRHVESVSVTPFSARARDRALHAVLVALCRLLIPDLSGNDLAWCLANSDSLQQRVSEMTQSVLQRVRVVDPTEAEATRRQLNRLIDEWREEAEQHRDKLHWSKHPKQTRYHAMLRNPDSDKAGHGLWKTLHSMRDVQAPTPVWILTRKQLEELQQKS